MAYEMSKSLILIKNIQDTPLGNCSGQYAGQQFNINTILRAGLPFHQGFLDYFDGRKMHFVSAYRKYKDTLKFRYTPAEYIASPPY